MAHKRRTAPGGTRGSVFKEVARIRREDARCYSKHAVIAAQSTWQATQSSVFSSGRLRSAARLRISPELRYLSKEPAPREAERLYQQMEQVYRWVNEETL